MLSCISVFGEEGTFAPIDLLDYIYGLLYHPEYRERYFEFLKVDFPRIPYPDSAVCFDSYKAIGGQLRKLHLMEEQPERTGVTYPEVGDNSVTQQKWADGKVWINKEQYFGNVPEEVWNYYIGGYQPAQKWLKDRRNTTLSFDDITHYQRIVHALATTIALQSELSQLPLPTP
ncbi:type ISP restriction/modification enzyme [Porphyromonas somerae]|uniref:type ISP restriction/modification enzyme n=1 Tax=Porphyromonas somerae TaxID=322095 RepID=UPI002A74EE78|nr:type ISP restriction/modification enzyme [Porphyromonas somerae]MDY3119458.1 type ISP restriction/modification enzyme [Porphyromonas somerae]